MGVEIRRRRNGFFQCLLFFLTLGTDFRIVVPPAHLRHGHAYAVGQVLHRFGKRQPLVFHNETDGRAVCAATEAMVKLLARADGKRRGFLLVERTAGHIVRAAFLQRNLFIDDVDHIDFG